MKYLLPLLILFSCNQKKLDIVYRMPGDCVSDRGVIKPTKSMHHPVMSVDSNGTVEIGGTIFSVDSIGTLYSKYNYATIPKSGSYFVHANMGEYGEEYATFLNGYITEETIIYQGKIADQQKYPNVAKHFKYLKP